MKIKKLLIVTLIIFGVVSECEKIIITIPDTQKQDVFEWPPIW